MNTPIQPPNQASQFETESPLSSTPQPIAGTEQAPAAAKYRLLPLLIFTPILINIAPYLLSLYSPNLEQTSETIRQYGNVIFIIVFFFIVVRNILNTKK